MTDIEDLPIAEIRQTLWYQETWLNDRLIQRQPILLVYWQDMLSWLHMRKMIAKSALARCLMKGMADPCPYCNKLIELDTWKRAFENDRLQ